MVRQTVIPGIGGLLGDEIGIDLFSGWGGWSVGFTEANGAPPAIAANHWPLSVKVHHLNHPETTHYCESIRDLDPISVVDGRKVGWLHGSPSCPHFSKARGALPKCRQERALAWLILRWVAAVKPRYVSVENVVEWLKWGPIRRGKLYRRRERVYFNRFVAQLRALGYVVEWRILNAAIGGAGTLRHRLFVVAHRDDVARPGWWLYRGRLRPCRHADADSAPVRWPKPTYGPGTRRPFREGGDFINWDIPVPSIFDRRKPLATNTCRRVATGFVRFVLTCDRPYIAPIRHPLGEDRSELVAAWLALHYSQRDNRVHPGSSLFEPLHTITAKDHHALCVVHLTKFFGTSIGSDLHDPLPTITGQGNHFGIIAAWLSLYYSNGGDAASLAQPFPTIVGTARMALVTVVIDGLTYVVRDLGMRMVEPEELLLAQGFPKTYRLLGTKQNKIKGIGNSVSPPIAAALVRANLQPRVMRRPAIAA